ncbi:hypothetical protein SAMN05661008_00002 [Alkalithermobacter thermoalcaliphilus JW-YL-7 = DSM 7308]|uniref:Uncharacterized protein n=1 Tax=Alkalithermobacter thermoalcaliphilus JW-YL-7 = DSM 7308 TaxID=1121328 RepID=A0A150FS68_CLOPD|nr:hypothetical protein JWYL7_1517 [[Clostridium] paradoxum JW-YL-7 = DSM 7308]SHK32184.1 hypothetical protein SAMN05661008_00002 [[Clostridium] paradoxum JW-YL-7 = DSM 7308]
MSEEDSSTYGINLTNSKKLKKYLPHLYEFKIMPNSALEKAIDEYISITKYRNKIIHYSKGNYKKVYNTEDLKKCIDDAPDKIEELFNQIYSSSEKFKNVGYPNWFRDRDYKNI